MRKQTMCCKTYNSPGRQHETLENLQQLQLIEINCAAMTWSERSELRVSAGAYTLVYVSRRYTELALSDTRHTSFYSIG